MNPLIGRPAPETPKMNEHSIKTARARFMAPPPSGDFWVFGYGSLMWNPGFDHTDAEPGLIYGYHRRFCLYSHRHRGTEEMPGLVLGLAPGGCCRGMAFRVARENADSVLAYLWDREMVQYDYRPICAKVRLRARTVAARTFVVDVRGATFAKSLDFDSTVRTIRRARGERGTNRDYLAQTVAHLQKLGIAGGHLQRLLQSVDALDRDGVA